ncbi:MAG: tyrosine-type recombinase/integrase [Prevotella sp.]|nr:tyrosine-type recombinase/integrase [Prevotella sp.]MCM1074212.1 tyrosine-type recombinase/integrase [Ruminococcus sp.]
MIGKFLAYLTLEVNASKCTVSAYGTDLRQLSQWLRGENVKNTEEADFTSVTLSDLRAWLAHLGLQGLSARTMRRKALSVRTFYRFLLREGVVSHSPASDLTLPKLGKPLPALIKEDELEKIVSDEAFATDDWQACRDSLIIDILYSTGLRRSELVALKDRDLDFARCEMRVLGKRRKERIVPLAPQLIERMKHYLRLRKEQWPEPVAGANGAFLLTNQGLPMNNTALWRIVKVELSSTTGKKTPHTLRHTFATSLLRDGAEINSVKELLGHSSLATTQIYTHLSFSELQHNYKLAHPRATKKTDHHGSTD